MTHIEKVTGSSYSPNINFGLIYLCFYSSITNGPKYPFDHGIKNSLSEDSSSNSDLRSTAIHALSISVRVFIAMAMFSPHVPAPEVNDTRLNDLQHRFE